MGQGGSSEFKEAFQTTVDQLSEVQLAEIGTKYNELYRQAGGKGGKVIDREKFSDYFDLPVALGDRLFEAFDKKKNGSIDFEEFVCGLAVLTQGSFSDKCQLLFGIFNLAGDEGISREELYSLLFAVVSSTNTIFFTLTEGGKTRLGSPISDPEKAVTSIVNTAFRNCDISKSGKLLPLEFEYWLKRNPKILDYLLPSMEDPEERENPTLASLLFVPNDDDDDSDDINPTAERSCSEDLTSIQLEGEDVIINIGEENEQMKEEDEEEEEVEDPGATEPPPSPLNEGKEDLNSEDIRISETQEGNPEGKADKEEGVDSKSRSTSSVSASEETIQLARQLSECLHSPVVEDAPSLVPSDSSREGDIVPLKILSAWLPSPVLQSMLTSGRKIPPEQLTQPGLISPTGKCDPIADILTSTFPGMTRRQQVSVEQVKLDEGGLHILLQNGCYHGALDLTSQFLSAHGQGMGQAGQLAMHTHKTLQMWSIRLALLSCLGHYQEVDKEMKFFKELDQPDLYYQYDRIHYPDLFGSMVPFPMRLLHAQLPIHLGNTQLAMNRTCLLQNTTQQILNIIKKGKLPLNNQKITSEEQRVAEEVWLSRLVRVKFAMCRCLMVIGDYSLVRTVLEEILELVPNYRIEVLSVLGRVCLLYGDLSSAERYFSEVTALAAPDSALNKTNRSFIDLYRNQWEIAEKGFLAAFHTDTTSTLNNAMVCAIHQQRLSEAISQLEDQIKNMPPSHVTPSIFLSLFSVYDLESSQSQAKKLSWLPYLGQHAPEGFNMMSLGLVTS